MLRATLVKLLAATAMGLELWLLPANVGRPLALLTLAMMVAFFAWVIVTPRSQFLVPSVHRMPDTRVDRSARAEGRIAFTFDDGPDPISTPRVLDLLRRHDARATFFIVGCRAVRYPELVRQIVAEGHAVGSHTYHHAHTFHVRSPRHMRAEILRGALAIAAITGSSPRLFRPPQGLRTPQLRDALASIDDIVCVTWTERGLDAMGRAADRIVRRVERALAPGAIITLHDGTGFGGTTDRRPTIEAFERLLIVAASRGLRCVSLSELETDSQ